MATKIGGFAWLVVAAPFLVIFALVLITIQSITGPIITQVPVSGIGGVEKGSIAFGAAWLVFAGVGMIVVPAAVMLYLFVGGDTGPPRRRRP